MTLHEAANRRLTALEARGLRPSTLRTCKQSLDHFGRFLDGEGITDLRRVTPETIRAWARELARYRYTRSKRYDPKPLEPTTRYRRLADVCHLFAWLVRERFLLTDPAAGVRPNAAPRVLPRNVLSESQVALLLATIDRTTPIGRRDAAIVELFYSTGLRVGELLALDLGDVDLSGGVVLVRAGKGGTNRVVPLGETAARAIGSYIQNGRAVDPRHPGVTALFLRADRNPMRGTRLGWTAIGRTLARLEKAAGLNRHITAHTFRHSVATHMLRAGAGIRHVQELLGHVRIRTTEIYTRVTVNDVREAHARSHPRGRVARRKRKA